MPVPMRKAAHLVIIRLAALKQVGMVVRPWMVELATNQKTTIRKNNIKPKRFGKIAGELLRLRMVQWVRRHQKGHKQRRRERPWQIVKPEQPEFDR